MLLDGHTHEPIEQTYATRPCAVLGLERTCDCGDKASYFIADSNHHAMFCLDCYRDGFNRATIQEGEFVVMGDVVAYYHHRHPSGMASPQERIDMFELFHRLGGKQTSWDTIRQDIQSIEFLGAEAFNRGNA